MVKISENHFSLTDAERHDHKLILCDVLHAQHIVYQDGFVATIGDTNQRIFSTTNSSAIFEMPLLKHKLSLLRSVDFRAKLSHGLRNYAHDSSCL
mmetsp:Transcript_32166/g.60433  ORF Transcript_32166/g.60433 Transcript_32166/m.60433 type:complete len:95 (-) Transcript_32166:1408-1692(-)